MPVSPSSVLVLYNTPSGGHRDDGSVAFPESEAGILEEVRAVCTALERLGVSHRAIGLRDLAELPAALYRNPAPVAINLVEGFQDHPADMTLVPSVCRAFGVEVTGSDTPCLSLALDKWKTNCLLAANRIRCPRGVLVPVGHAVVPSELPTGTCIVKPAASDASEGIDSHSILDASSPDLPDRVRQVHEKFNQPALIEEMIGQRELNISLLQAGNDVQVLAIAEIDFSAFGPGQPRIVGYAAKWLPDSFEYNHTPRIIPARITPEQEAGVKRMSLAAWETLGCHDYARVDIRLADDGDPVIIEVNPNPDISPDAGFAGALTAAGIPYDRFIQTLLTNASCRRSKPLLHPISHPAEPEATAGNVRIRYVEKEDREAVLALLTQPKFFRPDEIRIGEEVLDDSIRDGEHGHYQSFVMEEDRRAVGWLCFGPTPCTVNTYDIYWIAVTPDRQRAGLGRVLMEFAETRIRERGGRLAVIETSGRNDYEPTRRFYQKLGYHESARVRDFYAPGDDKIISVKIL